MFISSQTICEFFTFVDNFLYLISPLKVLVSFTRFPENVYFFSPLQIFKKDWKVFAIRFHAIIFVSNFQIFFHTFLALLKKSKISVFSKKTHWERDGLLFLATLSVGLKTIATFFPHNLFCKQIYFLQQWWAFKKFLNNWKKNSELNFNEIWFALRQRLGTSKASLGSI